VAVLSVALQGMNMVASNSKEDIWLMKVPFAHF
jgi:hypothetical protein